MHMHAGRLATSLGPELREALLGNLAVQQHTPRLHSLLRAAAESARQQQQQPQRAAHRSPGGHLGAAGLAGDSHRLQPQVEPQRSCWQRTLIRLVKLSLQKWHITG